MAQDGIEQKAAEAILQTPYMVKVGEKTYEMAQPTAGTLIAVSGMLHKLPSVDEGGTIINESLAIAKDCKVIYEIVAMLILGYKRVREGHKVMVGKGWRKHLVKEYDVLVDELMNDCTNKEVYAIVLETLKRMQVKDFFALSVSLHEMSLIQRTRGAEMTASGQ